MKGLSMTDWRLVQIFLSDDGVFEVEADAEDYAKMRCTCPVSAGSRRCKHIKLVRKRINENDGTYRIQIPNDISDEAIMEAMEDPDMFRELIIHHSKIEVID